MDVPISKATQKNQYQSFYPLQLCFFSIFFLMILWLSQIIWRKWTQLQIFNYYPSIPPWCFPFVCFLIWMGLGLQPTWDVNTTFLPEREGYQFLSSNHWFAFFCHKLISFYLSYLKAILVLHLYSTILFPCALFLCCHEFLLNLYIQSQ